jgi:hypothetical protein
MGTQCRDPVAVDTSTTFRHNENNRHACSEAHISFGPSGSHNTLGSVLLCPQLAALFPLELVSPGMKRCRAGVMLFDVSSPVLMRDP